MRGLDDLLNQLEATPSRVESRLAETAQAFGQELRDRAAEKLAGDVLHRRSGRLLGGLALSIGASEGQVAVRLQIDDAEVPYAAFQEFGFDGIETVRAHLRQIKQAFGRSIESRQIEVRTHDRRVNYPAHSFLRSALEEMTADAISAARETVNDAVGEQ
jgi:hypothetical protein